MFVLKWTTSYRPWKALRDWKKSFPNHPSYPLYDHKKNSKKLTMWHNVTQKAHSFPSSFFIYKYELLQDTPQVLFTFILLWIQKVLSFFIFYVVSFSIEWRHLIMKKIFKIFMRQYFWRKKIGKMDLIH
jgi:hypothetical protein